MRAIPPFLSVIFALTFVACSADVAEPELTQVDPSELTGEAAKADRAGRIGPAVARITADGRIRIMSDRLSRAFPDGGEIRRFAVTRLEDGFNLLRLGTNAEGGTHTDAIPLARIGGRLHPFEVKWIVSCFAPECENSGFCRPNYDKTDCFCADGAQCRFGIDNVPFETVTVDNPSYP